MEEEVYLASLRWMRPTENEVASSLEMTNAHPDDLLCVIMQDSDDVEKAVS